MIGLLNYTALFLIILVLHVADCQLDFTYSQRPQNLELKCTVGDLRQTDLSHFYSLVISRTSDGKHEVLASVSPHYDQDKPVSHIPESQVTGFMSDDHPDQSFLRIKWIKFGSDLDGNYTCELNGVSPIYLPVLLSRSLSLEVEVTEPQVVATPSDIRVGLSEFLSIRCSVEDMLALNLTKLASLEVFRIHHGIAQILATITTVSGAILKPGSGDATVNGEMNGNVSFIEVTWSNPKDDHTGIYSCEGSGIGLQGDPEFFQKQVNVTMSQPTQQELIERLHQLYSKKRDLTTKLEEVAKSANDSENLIQTIISQNNETNVLLEEAYDKMDNLKNASCITKCEDLLLRPGQHVVTLYPDDGLGPITVLCEVTGPGEVWTVFQKRYDGSVSFYQNFNAYEQGFGSVEGEFWLGLKDIRRLLVQNGNQSELRVDMMEYVSNVNHTKYYSHFSLGPGDDYRLSVIGDDNGEGMSQNSGWEFSTYDRNLVSCARDFRKAGWWFNKNCGYVNLNGEWGVVGKQSIMMWYEFQQDIYHPMGTSEMKFRQVS